MEALRILDCLTSRRLLNALIGTARIECGAGSMYLSGVRLSVHSSHFCTLQLQICARKAGDANRLLPGAQQLRRHSTAVSSEMRAVLRLPLT